jgi:hypothetical protein
MLIFPFPSPTSPIQDLSQRWSISSDNGSLSSISPNGTLSTELFVGVRLSEAIEHQRKRETELKQKKENGTESKANSCSKISSP